MKILCLDLSTNTGWCVINSRGVVAFGNIRHKVIGDETSQDYPLNFINMSHKIAKDISNLVFAHQPEVIVIEETNKGKNRYSQKQLEFIHYAVNDLLKHPSFMVSYLDTSEWRKLLGLSLDKEQRVRNNEVKKQRVDLMKSLIKEYDFNHQQDCFFINNMITGKRDQKRAWKEYNEKRTEWVKQKMKPFRSKIDGKTVGKIGVKNLSVDYVNKLFDLKFKKKDNDIADAICLGVAFYKKNNIQIEFNIG